MEELLTLLDPRRPDVRLEFGLARAEVAHAAIARAQAEQWSAITATLREARDFPELYLGSSGVHPDAVEFALRAAIADLAVRLSVSEVTVRQHGFDAETLQSMTPSFWETFREGEISAANSSTFARLLIGLPDDVVPVFEAELAEPARQLAPARFAAKARALRERLMDLLAGVLGAKGSVGVAVGVLVPVLTLLGGDEPGILEGHGPIDPDTARKLAAHAPSFFRILTHPVVGTIVDIDRTRYRPPADLKRMVQLRDQVCTFPGCGRPAKECEIDHITAWSADGKTAETNLADLCRHHHRIKDESMWTVKRQHGTSIWTSPTGAIRTADPPPF